LEFSWLFQGLEKDGQCAFRRFAFSRELIKKSGAVKLFHCRDVCGITMRFEVSPFAQLGQGRIQPASVTVIERRVPLQRPPYISRTQMESKRRLRFHKHLQDSPVELRLLRIHMRKDRNRPQLWHSILLHGDTGLSIPKQTSTIRSDPTPMVLPTFSLFDGESGAPDGSVTWSGPAYPQARRGNSGELLPQRLQDRENCHS
jgi:hypothetical protein